MSIAGLHADEALGIFAVSGTSTSILQSTITALNSDGATVGYILADPFGVAVPTLSLNVRNTWLKPKSISQWDM